MSLSNYAENAVGNHILRGGTAPMTAVAQAYLHLYAANPTEADSATELTTAGGYAPQAINFTAPTNGVFPNSNLVNFGTSTAAYSGAAAYVGIRDSATPNAGNLLLYGPNVSSTPVDYVAVASTDIFTSPGHGFVNTDLVVPFDSDTMPTGINADTRYFVVTSTTDTFQLSLTSGGAAINITANGAGKIAKDGTQTVTGINQSITVPIANLTASLF